VIYTRVYHYRLWYNLLVACDVPLDTSMLETLNFEDAITVITVKHSNNKAF